MARLACSATQDKEYNVMDYRIAVLRSYTNDAAIEDELCQVRHDYIFKLGPRDSRNDKACPYRVGSNQTIIDSPDAIARLKAAADDIGCAPEEVTLVSYDSGKSWANAN